MEASLTPTLILLNIIGGVCLLLWGLYFVKTSVQRAFGHNLHEFLASATSNRFQSFLSGLGLTFLLQSSTATALIMAALYGSGLVSLSAGIAIMLGADLATALLAFVFSLNIKWLAPLFVFTGFVLHNLFYKQGRKKYLGGLIISLGVMLFALDWIRNSVEPLSNSDVLPTLVQVLEGDMFMGLLIAAILTWLAHSSLAIVLLVVSFASAGLISMELGFAMVLGANLGGAIAPIIATFKDKAAAIRVPVANLVMRLVGVIIAFPFLGLIAQATQNFDISPATAVVSGHIGFNIGLAIIFLPFITPLSRITEKMILDHTKEDDPARPQYLDESQIDTPSVALTSAARETLRMADIVQSMLSDNIRALGNNDESAAQKIRRQDDVVDKLYKEIKLFLAKVSEEALDSEESDYHQRIMGFCINLEAAGDIIDKSLADMAFKKIEKNKIFSKNGWEDIQEIHEFVIDTLQNAQTVFLHRNVDMARDLIKGKDWIRKAETSATDSHLERIREGVPETIDTSSLHLDIIRDYRRINSHIATVAYPILEDEGHLKSKRLKSKKSKEKSG